MEEMIPDWAAISAITAVIVAIYTIYYKKRKKVSIELATEGRRSKEPKIYIIITNDKETMITIVRILIRENKKDLIELSTQDFELPKTIQYHSNIKLKSPCLAHNIHKIVDIYAEDSTGRRWGVKKKSLVHSKKILRNYIGNRLIFPSMGDEIDEDKIK